ncbi:MAG: hypothetical protein IK136_04885 [Oscillospiraceae bacterium]|nr:hypothetical protein [Oscillospiraceae bacterium]
MELITVHTPESVGQAASMPGTAAYMFYRTDDEGRLTRAEVAPLPRGGISGIFLERAGPLLAADILAEARETEAAGILFDAEAPFSAEAVSVAHRCSQKLPVYLPAASAREVPGSFALTETAVTGGSLRKRLADAAALFGPERVFLDIERLRMEFTLPHAAERGRRLTSEELNALYARRASGPHFSGELCAWYFRCRDGKGTRFILYDDLYSVRQKLSLASSMGIRGACLYYRETKDFIRSLLSG